MTDKLKGSRLVVTTGTANHLIADVWAVRNDFYRDHPEIVAGLVKGIFEGMDMVRKDPPRAAQSGVVDGEFNQAIRVKLNWISRSPVAQIHPTLDGVALVDHRYKF